MTVIEDSTLTNACRKLVKAYMPGYRNMESGLRKKRSKEVPKLPLDILDFDLTRTKYEKSAEG